MLPHREQPAPAAEGAETELSGVRLPDKGNPKLDSQLNQLVTAHTSKDAVSFALESVMQMDDGSVRVIVECISGEVDAAREAAGELGIVEAGYKNLLQLTTLVSHLETLANSSGILMV